MQRDKIQATVRAGLITKFENLLQEGKLYNIANFAINQNRDTYRTCAHEFKIIIHKETSIKEIETASILQYDFQFTTFHDILNKVVPEYTLIGKHSVF